MDEDTKKDLVVAGAAIAGIALGLSPLALAASGTIASSAWNRVARRAQRRAEQLVQCMVASDHEAETFAEQLRERVEAEEPDEEVLAAFRALLISAVQAVTPEALPAMGFIGRKLVRGDCTLPQARAALATLDVLDRLELTGLRTLMVELAQIGGDVLVVGALPEPKSGERRAWTAWPLEQGPTVRHPVTPIARGGHLFGTMKRAGAGTETSAYGIGGSSQAIEIERAMVQLLRDALTAAAV
jgi:hypothetical protein